MGDSDVSPEALYKKFESLAERYNSHKEDEVGNGKYLPVRVEAAELKEGGLIGMFIYGLPDKLGMYDMSLEMVGLGLFRKEPVFFPMTELLNIGRYLNELEDELKLKLDIPELIRHQGKEKATQIVEDSKEWEEFKSMKLAVRSGYNAFQPWVEKSSGVYGIIENMLKFDCPNIIED